MSITTCFPVGSASDNNYLNHNNNNEQANPNSNLINSLNSAPNQSIYRNKLTNHQSDLSTNLNSNNVIQNSKSDLMISGFDSFPLSRTTTPISYLTNSSLDGYLNNTNSTLGTPNPLNFLSSSSRCHSSNSNCSTNSKLNNHNNLTSRPASSFDNFLNINNDSNDSTTPQTIQRSTSASSNQSHPASVVSYYPHIILNENNFSNNLNSLSNLSATDLNVQTNATSTIHHSSNFNQQIKEEFLENSNYQSAINFNNEPLSNSTNNLNGMNNLSNSLNRLNTSADNELQSSNNLDFSNAPLSNKTKKRRNKIQGGPPSRPQCADCGKDFSNQSALSKHKLTHSDERKFVCTLCKKCNFKRQDHLNGHLYTHRDKKPYQCDFKNCEKTYCDARSLKRHKENHHSVFCQIALPLLSKNLPSDLASNLINAVKTTDGSRIQYAPASNDNEQAELDLSNAVIDPSLLNLTDRSQSDILQQLITQVDGNSTALSILQQHIAEQQSNLVECPTCQKKFKNLPALNGHMRLHGGYVRGSQPMGNQNNNQQRTSNQSLTNTENNKNEQPIDLIKKEDLYVDLTNNQTNSHSPSQQQTNNDSNAIRDKIRKHIANTPVIMENPEANRFPMVNNNSRVQYYSDETPNNLLSTSVINSNQNNTSPLVDQLQLDTNSPINSEAIIQEQDLLNNNSQITADKQIIHENSWFEDPNNVLHLKEQLQQQFRAPSNKIVQQTTNLNNNNLTVNNAALNRCPTTIPAHVFSGEKFRRHSDSTAEILSQNNNQNYNNPHHLQQSNGLINQSLNNNQINPNSIQQTIHSNTHSNGQGMTNSLHTQQQHLQSVEYHEPVNNRIESNNNNLINFDYLKRKHNRSESETSANETMETLPESQLINSSSNYLSTNNHNLPTNHHQLFYNVNNCNNNNLAYQSHSVPTTPTVVVNSNGGQNFFNHRPDLNNVAQQLNHTTYSDQLSNQQISHHQSHSTTQHLNQSQHQQHSLPCTPKQPTSFTFSPHQVQHYQQQSYHNQNNNNHYGSSPNTPITPVTPTSTNQYQQDNLILQQRPTNIHQQAIQSNNNLNTINSGHKNLYPNVEFNNNTICSRGKFGSQQSNYGMISNHQFCNDDLNNGSYSTMVNDDFMVNDTNYNEQQQFISSNCNQLNNSNLDSSQRNLNYQQINNSNNLVCSNSNYTQTPQISNVSNVIMSNYANTDAFCENDAQLTKNNLSLHCDSLNNILNEESTKKNNLQNNNNLNSNTNNLPINCTISSNTAPEKPSYTRVTLRSVSPNLVIETDSFKNSTADDSHNSNLNEDVDEEDDDDVFLKPTEINQAPISSPKTNCLNSSNNKKPKPYNNSSNGTYLAGSSSVNLPQVDFTHPQQPKLNSTAAAINSINDENKKLTEEHHINDINFNQIKISSFEKEKKFDLISQNTNYFDQHSSNKQLDRTNSPKKTKHRPSPLHIPPHVNARIHKSSRLLINDGSNLPPPYTPPPMLSPVRTNSSYYWYILTGNLTPKTTITNFFGSRKTLEQQQQQSTLNQAAVLNQQSIVNKNRSFDFFNESNHHYIPPSTAYEPLDSSLPTVETTFDFSSYSSANAHVNIGIQYQARIPAFNPNKEDAKLHYRNERAYKVWSPSILDKITLSNKDDSRQCKVIANSKRKTNLMKELELYLELSCSACVNGNGRNKEYAYHILYQNNGDLNKSIKQLLNAQPVIKPDHPLYNYKYAETDVWTFDEMKSYYNALLKYDKDFLTISKQLEHKSVKQCIEFYYLWKKVCAEEYKKHRTLRRKKEQEGIFSNNKM